MLMLRNLQGFKRDSAYELNSTPGICGCQPDKHGMMFIFSPSRSTMANLGDRLGFRILFHHCQGIAERIRKDCESIARGDCLW